MIEKMAVAQVLDTSGELCPLPVIKTKFAIDQLSSGQVLKVISTDPGSKMDFPGWAAVTEHILLAVEEDKNSFIFYIQKR